MKHPFERLRILCVLFAIMAIAACGEDEVTDVDNGDGPATLAGRIKRNNEFAFDLYGELKDSGD
ncbi:MAG TPA: hypothetical protein VMX58_03425, partial [Patescibacteria group bacterium]|nr:hypothetical protein [Patescibacteria group bacterium]